MSAPLALVLVVALAYLAAHLVVDRLARRFNVVSGAEYLLLGILLGPHATGLLTADVMRSFAPLTTLALGWLGAVVGMQLYLRELVRVPGIALRLALIESALTFLVVGAVEVAAVAWLYRLPLTEALLPGAALGGIAVASSSRGVELVTRRLREHGGERGVELTQLGIAVLVNGLFAVVAFGLVASVWHRPVLVSGRPITATEWMVITIGIGAVAGLLFHLFVRDERDVDRLFVSLTGGVILVSGAATYAGLSPILAALVFGAILVNSSRNRSELAAALERVERPLYLVLLVFAGAAWQPSARAWLWVLPVVLFLCVRPMAKVGGARLAARANGMLPVVGPDWGRGLVGQGGLALAIALNYVYQDGGTLPYFVFTAAVGSVLFTDLVSARLVESVVAPLIARRRGASGGGGADAVAGGSESSEASRSVAPPLAHGEQT